MLSVDSCCLLLDVHNALLDFRFWRCYEFSGKSWMKIMKIFIAFLILDISCGFIRNLHRLATDLPADSRVFPAGSYVCMGVHAFRALAKRPRFGLGTLGYLKVAWVRVQPHAISFCGFGILFQLHFTCSHGFILHFSFFHHIEKSITHQIMIQNS